jgi:hypothetical protein
MLKWELEEKYEALVREHEAFKIKVRDMAIQTAAEQSWCDDGLEEALDELGLERPDVRVSATVTVTFGVTGTTKTLTSDMETFLGNSLVRLNNVGLDEDWQNASVDYTEIKVTNCEVQR